ncbi:MAG: hypothetical protein CMO81_11015 [Waddliaceae bacterium]|nr:hypothetical protein [Waddliaceae bacterium]
MIHLELNAYDNTESLREVHWSVSKDEEEAVSGVAFGKEKEETISALFFLFYSKVGSGLFSNLNSKNKPDSESSQKDNHKIQTDLSVKAENEARIIKGIIELLQDYSQLSPL